MAYFRITSEFQNLLNQAKLTFQRGHDWGPSIYFIRMKKSQFVDKILILGTAVHSQRHLSLFEGGAFKKLVSKGAY